MADNSSHEAEAFLSLLWRHIYTRVRAWVFPHHFEHEPAGNDPVSLPLGFLRDVYVAGVVNGDALTYESATKHWIPGAGGGGSGQAFFEMIGLLFIATIPGPTNLTGVELTITRVRIASDGQCSGTAAGESFSFGSSGGIIDNDGLSTSWSSGGLISAVVSSVGSTGTYLTVDVYFIRS